jgi:hypothetical protein
LIGVLPVGAQYPPRWEHFSTQPAVWEPLWWWLLYVSKQVKRMLVVMVSVVMSEANNNFLMPL